MNVITKEFGSTSQTSNNHTVRPLPTDWRYLRQSLHREGWRHRHSTLMPALRQRRQNASAGHNRIRNCSSNYKFRKFRKSITTLFQRHTTNTASPFVPTQERLEENILSTTQISAKMTASSSQSVRLVFKSKRFEVLQTLLFAELYYSRRSSWLNSYRRFSSLSFNTLDSPPR